MSGYSKWCETAVKEILPQRGSLVKRRKITRERERERESWARTDLCTLSERETQRQGATTAFIPRETLASTMLVVEVPGTRCYIPVWPQQAPLLLCTPPGSSLLLALFLPLLLRVKLSIGPILWHYVPYCYQQYIAHWESKQTHSRFTTKKPSKYELLEICKKF